MIPLVLPQTLAAHSARGGHLLIVNDALADSHRSINIPLLLLDNHVPKLHGKILLRLPILGTK